MMKVTRRRPYGHGVSVPPPRSRRSRSRAGYSPGGRTAMMAETADRPARAAGNELTPSSSAGGIWALQVLAVLVLADGSLIALGIAGAAAVGTGVSAGGVAAGLAIGLAAAVPPAVFFLAAARRVGRPNRFVPMALAASGGVWLVLWTGAGSM